MLKQQCIFYLRKYLAYIYAFEDYKIVHELDRWDYKSRWLAQQPHAGAGTTKLLFTA